jgi:hypothetical protein
MAFNIREVVEGTQYQGVDEEIAYTITTTPWGSSPTSMAAVVKDASGTDVSSVVMPTGVPTANGDVVTLPTIKSLTDGQSYRAELKFTSGGNIFECHVNIVGQA